MNIKYILFGIIAVVVLVGGIVLVLSTGSKTDSKSTAEQGDLSIVDGKQIIDITAKGGYSPKVITAKADMPTILRVNTNSTFDCSSTLSIPSIGYTANLPPTGTTDVPVPPQRAGTRLNGLCAMGMYNFEVNFN